VLEGLQAPNNSLKPTRLAGENAEAPGLPSTYRMGGASPSRRAAQLEAVRQGWLHAYSNGRDRHFISHLPHREAWGFAVNKDEALRVLAQELGVFRSMSYQTLADLVGSPTVLSRRGADGTEYQIEVEVFPDSPRHPQGDLRVIASIDDGGLPSSIIPLTQDFIKSPSGDFVG